MKTYQSKPDFIADNAKANARVQELYLAVNAVTPIEAIPYLENVDTANEEIVRLTDQLSKLSADRPLARRDETTVTELRGLARAIEANLIKTGKIKLPTLSQSPVKLTGLQRAIAANQKAQRQ
jgi:hypothetical protein